MTIKDLSEKQKDELRDKIYWCYTKEDLQAQGVYVDDYTDEEIENILNKDTEDITDDDLEEWFGYIDFVDEDFSCDDEEDKTYNLSVYGLDKSSVAECLREIANAIENGYTNGIVGYSATSWLLDEE